MIVCGVEIKGRAAVLVLVVQEADTTVHLKCQTKKLELGDHLDSTAIEDLLSTIKAFAHQHQVAVFVIKSRALSGMRAAGGITFKIEALFQLSGTTTAFVSPPTLAKFAKSNLGGIPASLLAYQQDAYRVGAYHLSKV